MSEWQRENIMILCNSLSMKGKVRKTDYLEKGSTPVVDQSESFIAGYTDDKAVFSDPPYILFGDHTRIIKFIDFPFSPGADGVKVLKAGDKIDSCFLAYYLRYNPVQDLGYSRHFKLLKEQEIPLPPLGEQKLIAEILGGVSKAIQILEHELQLLGEISVLEQQNNLSTQKLSDLVTIRSGTVDPTLSVNRNLPHIAPDSIEKNTGRILQIRSCEEDKVTSGKYHFYKGDVLYSKIRPYLNKVVIAPFEGLCSADMYALRPKEGINSEVLQALLMSKDFLAYAEQWSGRASIPKINRKALLAYNVPKMTDKQVNEVKAKIQSIHKVVELKCRKLSLLQELQKSLANRAFAGLL
jgi:hypothetical protein